jgi:DNA mismatch repair protein MSH5
MQINSMLHSCTSKSLLLIDEFGKGTLSIDGLALLASTLQFLANKGKETPKVFCTTHFTEIIEYKLVDIENPLIQFLTMQVHVEETVTNANDVVFLYKLGKGKIIPSYGTICAEIAGIPKEILVIDLQHLTLQLE